jgi:hypothetical protein
LDDEDKTECRQLLVTTAAGWRTEMAKWIGDACTANDDDSEDDSNILAPATSSHEFKWKNTKLEILFGGLPKRSERVQTAVNQEIELMEALANEEEDAIPDHSAIDCSDDDFDGRFRW